MPRSDQHPFTPEPHEPDPWPDHDRPHIDLWGLGVDHVGHPIGIESQLLFDVTEAKHKAWEERAAKRRRDRIKKYGFILGFITTEELS